MLWTALLYACAATTPRPGDTDAPADGGAPDTGAEGPALAVSFEGAAVRTALDTLAVTIEATGGVPPEVALSLGDEVLATVAMTGSEQRVEVLLPACVAGPLRAEAEGYQSAASAMLTVVPQAALAAPLDPLLAAGPLPEVVVDLYDARGGTVSAPLSLRLTDAGSDGAGLAAPGAATSAFGQVRFVELRAVGEGTLALTVEGADGCPLAATVHEAEVGEAPE